MNYKLHGGIFAFLLALILLMGNENLGMLLLLVTGLYGIYISVTVSKEMKTKKYDFITPTLIAAIVYLPILFFYGIGGIGMGDKGLVAALFFLLYLIFAVLSVLISLFIKTKNTKSHKKILTPIAIGLALIVFWPSFIIGTATLFENPMICSMQIEAKSDSFIFTKGSKNWCLDDVARRAKDPDICLSIKDENFDLQLNSIKSSCLSVIAWDLERADICRKIDISEDKNHCLETLGMNTNDPELCLEGNSFHCVSMLAREDKSICDFYEDEYQHSRCLNY